MPSYLSLLVPLAYITILLTSLYTFSNLYRRRKALSTTNLTPWFPLHLQRTIYLSLLHIEPAPGSDKPPNVPDSVLKTALLQRACEDIRRVLHIRERKGPLSTLLQRGSVGEEVWKRFERAEKEVEAELRDVVEEANALRPGWGSVIFQSANEMVNNALIRDKVAKIQATAKSERDWWDKERASIQSQFMKELDEEGAATEAEKKAGAENRRGSDEDAVLIDAGGPATPGSKGAKKRKGKK